MATTDLKLKQPGSIAKPGPVGRLVRFVFGVASVYYVVGLLSVRAGLLTDESSIRPLILNGLLPSVFLVSYVVNIGFSRAWKKWPALVSVALILASAGVGYIQSSAFQSLLLARTIWALELYLFTHLGLSFLLSAILATPGCEMRSFHHLYSIVTGKPTPEHHCPVGPLSAIDRWEKEHRNGNDN